MFFSRKKKKHTPSNSVPANGHPPQSQASQSLQFPTKSQSQSHSQSPQQTQQSQPLYPWSAHTLPSGQWPSPIPRRRHALSTTATAAGELFLFGGKTPGGIQNDLYVISIRDFSTTLLKTSGDVPSPRFSHRAVLTSTALLIWGGKTDLSDQKAQYQSNDDSFYLLNLGSREWTRIVVDGPGPGGRSYHTMTLVGSKLFVFGGWTAKGGLNDIWALDLNCLKSNPFWESYEPAPGNEKPLPRAGHVSVTTGDRIIIFGGRGDQHDFNDTWSFNISTRKWTELQCTGSIPSPRGQHAAVLVSGVMYVFGGSSYDTKLLGDLTALNLSTQRWIAFQDIGPSPCGRCGHAMASDGTRVFVLGGGGAHNEAKLIHVLDTERLDYPEPDSDAVNQEIARLEDGRLIELERQLLETLVAKTERDQRIAELTDKLALKSVLLEQTEANSTEERKRAGLELRELQAKLDESLLSRDHALEQAEANAAEAKKRAGLELRELQAKLDESLLSRDHPREQAQSALQKASCAADANEQSQREPTEMRAELEASKSELAALRLRLADAENGCAESKTEADTYRNQTATGLVNTDEDRVVHRLMERMQVMEAEIASLRGNEKSFERMVCRNEG